MMNMQVALLRGINVGTAKRVAMADLRTLLEGLGFRDVRTLLNSGNVVFSAPKDGDRKVAARIEKAIAGKLRVESRVVVLSGREVADVVRDNPLAEVANDPSRLLVVVPRDPSDRLRLTPLLKTRWGREVLAIGTRAAYLWCADGIGVSELWPEVDRALERSGTGRNIATMTKLLAMVGEAPSLSKRGPLRRR